MIAEIKNTGLTSERTRTRMVERLREKGIHNEDILNAMNSVPRHAFIDEGLASRAYEDSALPIGFSQTISQPYVIAFMIEALMNNRKLGKVLEVGTGCGYQTAVLAKLAKEVYSIERIRALHDKARSNLRSLRLVNVRLHYGDGYLGLAEAAPFDSIILSAAPTEIPLALLQQLVIGGKMILPQGKEEQRLLLITRTANGHLKIELEAVRFVPLVMGVE